MRVVGKNSKSGSLHVAWIHHNMVAGFQSWTSRPRKKAKWKQFIIIVFLMYGTQNSYSITFITCYGQDSYKSQIRFTRKGVQNRVKIGIANQIARRAWRIGPLSMCHGWKKSIWHPIDQVLVGRRVQRAGSFFVQRCDMEVAYITPLRLEFSKMSIPR